MQFTLKLLRPVSSLQVGIKLNGLSFASKDKDWNVSPSHVMTEVEIKQIM